MKKKLLLLCAIALMTPAFGFLTLQKLNSSTYIKANDAFILGNNAHAKFSIRIKNISKTALIIGQSPIAGGIRTEITLSANQVAKIQVDRNNLLRIDNPSNEEAAVSLQIKGDTGLSMGYKNQ